jgi:hypothetical protein
MTEAIRFDECRVSADSKPSVWANRADEILASIARLAERSLTFHGYASRVANH